MTNSNAQVNLSPSAPTPPPPPVPPVPTVYCLISVKSSTHDILPVARDVIKIRLIAPIAGPASTIISSELTHPDGSVVHKRRSNSNYHTVIVREVTSDLVAGNFTLHVWPVPAYSRATNLGYTSTLEWFLDQPVNVRNQHVPMPCRPGMAISPTPGIFGPPLSVGGYTDRVHGWVLLEPHEVTMSFEKTVSTHTPYTYHCLTDTCYLVETIRSTGQSLDNPSSVARTLLQASRTTAAAGQSRNPVLTPTSSSQWGSVAKRQPASWKQSYHRG